MRFNSLKLTVLCLLIMLSTNLFAQQIQPLPQDPKIRYGKLDNGLTYYIRANKEPKERAEFHIAQNVGAILENDDQNGLAHFLEHMAFNGTKNFPGKGIINYFEKNGVKFGYDINAYTSLDETVYRLSNVPTNREGLLDSALLVLHDWSNFISLEDAEIDSERGVIREEWRTGNGADRRMWKESNMKKYPSSQYAKRDIIGDTAIINNFTHKTLRDYYKKWYRPDLQAIIVVGDVDVDRMEAKIKQLFSDISKKDNFGERPVYEIANNDKPIVSIITDPEATNTQIDLEFKKDKLPKEMKLSMSGYVVDLVGSLIGSVLGERFSEMSLQADAPFAQAYAYYGELVKSKDAFQMTVIPKEGKELEGLNALLLEAEKMKRFGFTNAEIDRAKTNMLKRFEKSYNERDNQKSINFAREYIRNYLKDEPIPGIEFEYQTVQMILPKITTEMVNQLAKSYITDSNLVVSVMAPEKVTVKVPAADQILAAIDATKKAELTAKAEEVMNKPLMDKTPKAGKVKSIKQNKAMETTEMTLSNGIKLVFKPTTFKKDEISLNAFSYGGLSKVHNVADLPSGKMADGIVQANGVGNYTAVELGKILTGKIASVNPYIDQYEEGMNGNSSVKDFETMLQLVYLYFTQPRKDDNSYTALINMYRTQLANIASNPNKAFHDSIQVTTTGNDPRTILESVEMLDKVSQDKAMEIYKERFANPADFTFAFVGNIDPNNKEIQKLLATYLGSLKTNKKNTEKFDNVYREFPKGKIDNYFTQKMKTKKASNRIYYTADMPFNITNQVTVSAISDILDIRYLESIREKEGGSYGVGVYGGASNVPKDQAIIIMQFDTDPEKQVKLMGIIHDELTNIISKGPLKEDLEKVKENLMKQYKQDLEQNSWWSSKLKVYYQDGLNYRTDYKSAVDALTSESIQKTLKSIADQKNVIEIVMKPAAE